MNSIIALYVTTQMALDAAKTRLTSDEGQTSIEWLGIAFVCVSVIGVVVGFKTEMGEAVRTAFTDMITSITGG